MKMIFLPAFVSLALAALNAAMYAHNSNPVNMFSAVFCFGGFFFCLFLVMRS